MNRRNHITFLLGQKEVSLTLEGRNHPFTRLIDHLRDEEGLRDVKEGCGVGDCGACTVVLARPGPEGRLEYVPVNSCLLLLPMVHGCQVITAAHLARNGILHPVQQALVDHHGSQCGFCTPGLVMSMYALWMQGGPREAESIAKYLSGNLCRCTGYQPIIEAMQSAMQSIDVPGFQTANEDIYSRLAQIRDDQAPITAGHLRHTYTKVFRLTDALDLLSAQPETRIIAGNTDLGVKFRLPEEPTHYLDISGIAQINDIRYEAGYIELGAARPLEKVRLDCRESLPPLAEMLDLYASTQVRHTATAGGSLGTASPIGDLSPVLLAIGAEVVLQKAGQKRRMRLEDFITGYRTTALQAGEMITHLHLPIPGPGHYNRAYKVSRRKEVDISSVSACFSLELEGGKVTDLRIAYGGMAAKPLRLRATEEFMLGKPWNNVTVEEGMEHIRQSLHPIRDVRGDASTRSLIAGNLLRRFYLDSLEWQQQQGLTL
ncbi:MAG: FAD binding domain-containing protein [Bacteroidales bacterium]|nr:FAD binding domain-containing protein [Bacteroidales bacterium]